MGRLATVLLVFALVASLGGGAYSFHQGVEELGWDGLATSLGLQRPWYDQIHYMPETCEHWAPLDLDRVPEQVVVHVHHADGESLYADRVREALLAFPFPIHVVEGGAREPAYIDGVLRLVLHVYSHTDLRGGDVEPAGFECRQRLFAEESDPTTFRFIVVHELGHALGLGHQDGTWMQAETTHQERGSLATWSADQAAYMHELVQAGEPMPDPDAFSVA